MNSLKKLEEDRIDLLDEYETLTKEAASRELVTSESSRLGELDTLIKSLDAQIKPLKEKEERLKKLAGKKAMETNVAELDDSTPSLSTLDFQILKSIPADPHRPVSQFVLKNFDVDEKMQEANVYDVIAGLAGRKYPLGSPTDYALDQVKKSALTPTALLNPYLSAQLLDSGLPKSRLVQAGMKTFGMVEGTHKFARIATYPTLEWKAELSPTTERTVTFDAVTFETRTLRGWIEIGGETLLNALNIRQALQTVFSRALADGIDSAGLFGVGSGSDQPLGVANYPGIPTVIWNDTLANFDWLVAAQKLVYDENGPDLTASIMSPDAWSQLARIKGTSEFQPVPPPFFFQNHKFLQTSKVPQDTGTGDQSEIVIGGFENLNLGVRLQAEIMLTPVIAETFSYKMLAVFCGDFQPNRIEDFALVTNVDPSPELT